MTIHKLRPLIPDMTAVEDQTGKSFDRLEMLLEALELCHYIDQDLRLAAVNSLKAARKAFELSLRVE